MKQACPYILTIAGLALASCGRQQSPSAPAPAVLPVPVQVTVAQRSTTAVPGSQDQLLLTIDDITRNQVMVSLTNDDQEMVLPVRSMSPSDSIPFEFSRTSYVLTLKALDNALVGEDFATFIVREPSLTEQDKIEQLIQGLAALQDATFIRNGVEHDAEEAADHLRSKWRAVAEDIETAQQFIDAIASNSSFSGKPYEIRLGDGTLVLSGDYLRDRLQQIETDGDP